MEVKGESSNKLKRQWLILTYRCTLYIYITGHKLDSESVVNIL